MELGLRMNEIVELILNFYDNPTNGYWDFEIEECPEVKKFVDLKFTCEDDERKGLIKPNATGHEVLHTYIEEMSLSAISFMKKRGMECPMRDVEEWFLGKYELDDTESAAELVKYIVFKNIHNYGYKGMTANSSQSGPRYRIEKIA